jgi:uncharacterized protein (DUF58 family)
MNRYRYALCVLLVLAGVILHQALLVVCGVVILLVVALRDIWAKYCLNDLRYQRHFSERKVLFGEKVTLSLSVENAKLLPLPWLEVEDTLPRTLDIEGERLRRALHNDTMLLECLFSPGWYERVTRRYTVHCNMRGVHGFGPTVLRSGDVFGFTTREMLLANHQYILVYPLVVPLTHFGLPARHPFGERRAPRRLLEDPARVIGVRDYMYGDSLRRVHWKATARAMQLQSKVYEATTTYTLVLFLNVVSQLDAYYGIHPDLHELAICAAASVTNWAIDEGYAVGLYANTIMFMPDEEGSGAGQGAEEQNLAAMLAAQLKRRRIHLPAASSEEQRRRIMETLARIQTFFGSSLEDVIMAERTHLPAGATVVIITSVMSERLVEQLVHLRRGGHSVAVLFIGDRPSPFRLADVTVYHLGGESAWKDLLERYGRTSTPTPDIAAGLRL